MRRAFLLSCLCLFLLVLAPAATLLAQVPDGFSRVVLLATEKIDIKKDVIVHSGDIIVNEGGGELTFDEDGTTPAGFDVKADEVEIKNGVVVGGNVHYNELDNDGTINGSEVTPLALPVFSFLPPFFDASPGSDDVEVDNGDTLVLAPGAYAELKVEKNATLILSGGEYDFDKIELKKNVQLVFEGRTQVRVADDFKIEKNSDVGPAVGSGLDASELIFYVGDDATIEKGVVLEANIYAPNSKIDIKKNVQATGAFVAREIQIDEDSQLNLNSFFNEPPVAVDDSATVAEGGAVSILDSGETSVLANDTDPNGDNLTVTTGTTPAHGTLVLNPDGTFSYTHDGGETTSDSFDYEVCDDGTPIECDTGTVFITITPVNDPPVAQDDSATTDEDNAVNIDVLTNDSDVDGNLDPASVNVTGGPANGSTLVEADGSITYSPDADFNGSDSFTYEVCDDGTPTPAECDTATVGITIHPVNDDPVADPQSRTTSVDTTIVITLTGSDIDGDALTFSIVTPPTAGRLNNLTQTSPTSATVEFEPRGIVTEDSFVFQVDDGNSGFGTATVTVDVQAGNSQPTANDATVVTDGTNPLEITLTGSDPNGDALTFSIVSGPSAGNLSGVTQQPPTSAKVTYTANAANVTDSFVFRVDDGNGGTDTATVTINPETEPDNSPPVARPDGIQVANGGTATTTTTGAASLLDNDFDPDGDDIAMTTTAFNGPSRGTVTLNANGTFSYTHDGSNSAADSFRYRVCDDGTPVECSFGQVNIRIDALDVTVSVQKAGDGSGRVFSDPSGIDCGATCSAEFPGFIRVDLIASADFGSRFVGFTGDIDCEDGNVTTNGDITCIANFELEPPPPTGFTLTVVREGDGRGSVSSNPSGIVCGGDCTESYGAGTVVRLFARPDDGASVFVGFGGDPDCADAEVTMDADKTCTATFVSN